MVIQRFITVTPSASKVTPSASMLTAGKMLMGDADGRQH